MLCNHLSQPASLSVGAARLYELLLDAYQLDRHILGCYAHDSPDILVAHILQPQQYDAAIYKTKLVDAFVQLLYLKGIIVGIGVGIDVDTQFHTLAAASLLSVKVKAGVKTYPPYPGVDVAVATKCVKTAPHLYENLLEKVLNLNSVIREHIAHSIYGAFMSVHNFRK